MSSSIAVASLRRGAMTGILVKVVTAIAPLVLVPLVLHDLGRDAYGLWSAAGLVASLLAVVDLGLGNALLTRIPAALGDTERRRQLVSTAFTWCAAAAGLVLVMVIVLGLTGTWARLFRSPAEVGGLSANLIIAGTISAFVVTVPLLLVQRLLYADQRAATANLWQAVASLAAIPLVLFARLAHQPLLTLAGLLLSTPLVWAIVAVWQFTHRFADVIPAPGLVTRQSSQELLSLSLRFALLSVAVSLATGLDGWIITATRGPGAVAELTIPQRVFAQLAQLIVMVTLPLWAASSHAFARRDPAWVARATYLMSLVTGAFAVIAGVVLVITGPWLLRLWTGQDLGTSRLTIAGLASWCVMLSATSPLFMAQNARAVIWPQLLGWLAFGGLSVPVKYVACSWVGVAGLIWAGVFLSLLTVVPGCVVGFLRALRTAPA